MKKDELIMLGEMFSYDISHDIFSSVGEDYGESQFVKFHFVCKEDMLYFYESLSTQDKQLMDDYISKNIVLI